MDEGQHQFHQFLIMPFWRSCWFWRFGPVHIASTHTTPPVPRLRAVAALGMRTNLPDWRQQRLAIVVGSIVYPKHRGQGYSGLMPGFFGHHRQNIRDGVGVAKVAYAQVMVNIDLRLQFCGAKLRNDLKPSFRVFLFQPFNDLCAIDVETVLQSIKERL